MPDTLVVIVTHNTRELTLRCVAGARVAAGLTDAVVVVADNGSADGTAQAVRTTFPDVVVIENPDNPGYGAAVNRAAETWNPVHLCAMNADAVLAPDTIVTLRRFLESHDGWALVGPRLFSFAGAPQASCKRFPTLGFALAEVVGLHSLLPRNLWIRRFYYHDRDPDAAGCVDSVSGAVMFIRGEAFRKVRGFDEGFWMYFEETDLCRRLADAGYRVGYCPSARATHFHGASTLQTSVRQIDYYLSYVRFFGKHQGRKAAWSLATGIAVGTVLRAAALVFKYRPLRPAARRQLRTKVAECWRLLRALRTAVTAAAVMVSP